MQSSFRDHGVQQLKKPIAPDGTVHCTCFWQPLAACDAVAFQLVIRMFPRNSLESCLLCILDLSDRTNLEVKEKSPIHLRPSELSPVFSQLELVFEPIEHLYIRRMHFKLP